MGVIFRRCFLKNCQTANAQPPPEMPMNTNAQPDCGRDNPALSIVIVNFNTRQLVCDCLHSIFTHPPRWSFEIFAVDNGSTDGSCEARQFPGVKLIQNECNLGFS